MKRSPADETEIVWIEKETQRILKSNKQIEREPRRERTILIRVIDRKRVGSHRTGIADHGELDSAVRAAIAQSRSREPLPGLLHFSADDTPLPTDRHSLWDPRIETFGERELEKVMAPWLERRSTIKMELSKARIAVCNSRGLRRRARVTAASMDVRISRTPGAGH